MIKKTQVSWWCVGVLTAVATLHSSPIAAQESSFNFELTPYIAYRIGGTFEEEDGDAQVELNDSNAEGLIFNITANPNGQYELLYARQRTDANTSGFFANDPTIDMEVEHFQIGGTYLFDGDSVRPFIALTLGLSRYDPELPGTDSESFFSSSFGGGVQLNSSKRLGVRLEARVFTTFVDDDSNVFCSSIDGAGTCLIRVDSTILTQWEARAGLVFRF